MGEELPPRHDSQAVDGVSDVVVEEEEGAQLPGER